MEPPKQPLQRFQPTIREVDVDPSVSRVRNRSRFRKILVFAVHVPSTCILLLVFGVIKSVWTAALLMIGGIGVVIGLAVVWGLRESRDAHNAAAEPVEPADTAAGKS